MLENIAFSYRKKRSGELFSTRTLVNTTVLLLCPSLGFVEHRYVTTDFQVVAF